jgi:hypothetical protein
MRRRGNLTMLMGLVAVVALGLGMMKYAANWLARGVVLAALVCLLFVTIAAIVRRRGQATWIGTAVFGWGYCLLILTALFVHVFVTDTHGNPLHDWWMDDLARPIADRFHPEPPFPADPFLHTTTVHNPKNPGPTKVVDDKEIPFTPDDLKAQAEYDARRDLYNRWGDSVQNATMIGLTIQGTAFALIGGATGRVLSDRSTTADETPGAEPSTSTG